MDYNKHKRNNSENKTSFPYKIILKEKQGNYKAAGRISEKYGLFKKAIENHKKSKDSLDKIVNIKKRILNIDNKRNEVLKNIRYLDTSEILRYQNETGIIFPEGIINEISN